MALVVACAGWLVSPSAGAEVVDTTTKAAARDLGTEGVEAYLAGDFQTALQKIGRAYDALPVPSLGLWSARAMEQCGLLVEAQERYLETTRLEVTDGMDRAVQTQAREDAARERALLVPRIPKVTVSVQGAPAEGLSVLVDGKSVPPSLVGTPLPTNPGELIVVATSGGRRVERSLTIAEGQSIVVLLSFEAEAPLIAVAQAEPEPEPAAPYVKPTPAAPSDVRRGSWQPVAGWVGVGVGGGLLAMGLITGLMAQSQYDSLDCDAAGSCASDTDLGAVNSVNTLRTVSVVGFTSGGIVTAAGVSLLLIPIFSSSSSSAALQLGAPLSGLVGTF